MIRLEQVSKVYPSPEGPVRALDEVTLDVAAGRFVAVRGPSGCGKTTLLSLVGGLASPTSGRVHVAGRELSAISALERAAFRASTIGFVFQMFHLLPYLSVLENVLVAALPGHEADAQVRARELLEKFQLGHRLKHRPAELSTGERQRVAIARAMLNSPQVILADEPTGNLDPDNAAGVFELLSEFQVAGGTVLLATHDEAAAAQAESTVWLRQGRVAESEPILPQPE